MMRHVNDPAVAHLSRVAAARQRNFALLRVGMVPIELGMGGGTVGPPSAGGSRGGNVASRALIRRSTQP